MAENGASLEDCHTNLFALTDLSGIRWRRMVVAQADACFLDPLDDPVLISYSKCIQADILCVWRRQPRSANNKQSYQNHQAPKELWLFWYGEEPATMASLISPDLHEEDQGSWDSALTYECRTLLFKALHNLMERCLMAQNFMRVGKWFVQPYSYNADQTEKSSANLSISFLFFLHGESTVCASIDVRQHPPLFNLRQSHLHVASQLGHGIQVLLAPYSLAGHLTGRSYTESDPKTQKLLEDWRRFYYLSKGPEVTGGGGLGEEGLARDGGHMPAAVEVVVAGVRLRYPTCFVMVTGETEMEILRHHSNLFQSNSTTNNSSSSSTNATNSVTTSREAAANQMGGGEMGQSAGQYAVYLKGLLERRGEELVGGGLVERTWQDSTVCSGLANNLSRHQQGMMETDSDERAVSLSYLWDFGDPVQKNNCNCSRTKGLKSRTNLGSSSMKTCSQSLSGALGSGKGLSGIIGGSGKAALTPGGEKTERGGRHSRSFAPYHRRASATSQNPLEFFASAVAQLPSDVDCPLPLSRKPMAAGGAASALNGVRAAAPESPHSTAPSPLMSSSHPAQPDNSDPMMPTLSPHPPPLCGGGGGKAENKDAEPAPAVDSFNSAAVKTEPPTSQPTIGGSSTNGPQTTLGDGKFNPSIKHGDHRRGEMARSWLDAPVARLQQLQKLATLRRPILKPMFEKEDEEELSTSSFYSYAPNEVFDHLGKRVRSSDSPLSLSHTPLSTGLTGDTSGGLMTPLRPLGKSPGATGGVDEDPYRFSDDMDSGGGIKIQEIRNSRDEGMGYMKHSPQFNQGGGARMDDTQDLDGSMRVDGHRNSLDLSAASPSSRGGGGGGGGGGGQISTTLMRENDLIANMQDLDKLFDTDEENDADSPPSSAVTDLGSHDDHTTSLTSVLRMGGTVGSLAANISGLPPGQYQGPTPPELSRMFPTPPSAENPFSEPSPMQSVTSELSGAGSDLDTYHHLHHMSSASGMKEEHHHTTSTALQRRDRPFVYKVAMVGVFPSSKDYDVIDLPSHHHTGSSSLISSLVYKPSQQNYTQDQQLQPQGSHFTTMTSMDTTTAPTSRHLGGGETSQASLLQSGPHSVSQRMPQTPMSFELMSPASNCSSTYLNRNLGSIDAGQHSVTGCGTGSSAGNTASSRYPEVNSLIVNIALSDTILNLFKDQNFDSCTFCACNLNIEGPDVGHYLPDRSNSSEQYRCVCAFSAVINRKYGVNAGLFYEDEVDIIGGGHSRFDPSKPPLAVRGPGRGEGDGVSQEGQNLLGDGGKGDVVPFSSGPGSVDFPTEILMLFKDQLSSLFPSPAMYLNYSVGAGELKPSSALEWSPSLEMRDGKEACLIALEFSRQVTQEDCSQARIDENSQCLHKWPYQQSTAKLATNSQDVIRLLRSLQPLLQDALQKKRSTKLWESVYTITGPLSWKDFHLMAGRGSEETSEPKPVPAIVVGYEKDWLSLLPHSVRYWDKLFLEPYGQPRDVTYVIVAPDNDHVLQQAGHLFRELSVLYEQCLLGRHRPLADKLPGGVMRVGRTSAGALIQAGDTTSTDPWFSEIGNSNVAKKLRLYATICQNTLASVLTSSLTEKKVLYEEAAEVSKTAAYQRLQQPSRQAASANQSSQSMSATGSLSQSALSSQMFSSGSTENSAPLFGSENSLNDSASQNQLQQHGRDGIGGLVGGEAESEHIEQTNVRGEFGVDGPFIVVYMVDPFSYTDESKDVQQAGGASATSRPTGAGESGSGVTSEVSSERLKRLSMVGLLRCYNNMISLVPAELRSLIQLQIIPLQVLLDFNNSTRSLQFLKNTSFSVYTHCRRVLHNVTPGHSLTGFGPAASFERLMKDHTSAGNIPVPTPLYTPPFILAPGRDSTSGTDALSEGSEQRAGVLFCAYCLSEDQRWLLASCTDSCGEIMETTCINIEVVNRQTRRRPAPVRRAALQKLWEFVLSVMGGTTVSWRIVVGRFGRLGHGEMKGWSALLSRKNLVRSSRQLRDMCSMCSLLPPSLVPSVLSACLVSLELHPSIHIMVDSIKREENPSSKAPLSTPNDLSATHILVFPTSATAQANVAVNMAESHMDEQIDFDMFVDDEEFDDSLLDIMKLNMPSSPAGSPKNNSGPSSPTQDGGQGGSGGVGGVGGGLGDGGQMKGGRAMQSFMMEQEESTVQNILQQPLAMGFYVSTASPGPLPKWFWSSCMQREKSCPTCFKAALHIHCATVQQSHAQDDLMHHAQSNTSNNPKHSHPLDSNLTCDVLRYVLETYNQLSWLTIDPMTTDRRSCLPAHILILMQLYHGFNSVV